MNCPKCSTELRDDAAFCDKCGSNLSGLSGESELELVLDPLAPLHPPPPSLRTAADEDPQAPTMMIESTSLVPPRAPEDEDPEAQTIIVPADNAGAPADEDDQTIIESADDAGRKIIAKRYQLFEELGKGGFATVYRARDNNLDREVAVKQLHAEKLVGVGAEQVVKRFRSEALTIARLKHRNIVEVYDYNYDDDGYFIVMEFIEGGTLDQHIKANGQFEVDAAIEMLKDIAQGLHYAHRNKLVHRDIKPSNVMLGREEGRLVPKIVDFGLAQAGGESELSKTGYAMGTPGYMAPEQRRDAKNVDHRADIYSLGKVLYELLTGEKAMDILPKLIPEPHALTDIIFKCVNPKPEDRYFSVDELIKELENVRQLVPKKRDKMELITFNVCAACDTPNEKYDKFCAKCGAALTFDCPECSSENSVHRDYCTSCGTDIPTFRLADEAHVRMKDFASAQKWSRVIKEYELLPSDLELTQPRGSGLLAALAALHADACTKLETRDEIRLQLNSAIESGNYKSALKLAAEYQEIDASDEEIRELPDRLRMRLLDGEIRKSLSEGRVQLEARQLATCRRSIDAFTEVLEAHPPPPESAGDAEWQAHLQRIHELDAELRERETELSHVAFAIRAAFKRQDFAACIEKSEQARELTTEDIGADEEYSQAQVMVEKIDRMLAQGRELVRRREWSDVEAVAAEILKLQATNADARSLRQQAQAAIGQRRRLKRSTRIGAVLAILAAMIAGALLYGRDAVAGTQYWWQMRQVTARFERARGLSNLAKPERDTVTALLNEALARLQTFKTDRMAPYLSDEAKDRNHVTASQISAYVSLNEELRRIEDAVRLGNQVRNTEPVVARYRFEDALQRLDAVRENAEIARILTDSELEKLMSLKKSISLTGLPNAPDGSPGSTASDVPDGQPVAAVGPVESPQLAPGETPEERVVIAERYREQAVASLDANPATALSAVVQSQRQLADLDDSRLPTALAARASAMRKENQDTLDALRDTHIFGRLDTAKDKARAVRDTDAYNKAVEIHQQVMQMFYTRNYKNIFEQTAKAVELYRVAVDLKQVADDFFPLYKQVDAGNLKAVDAQLMRKIDEARDAAVNAVVAGNYAVALEHYTQASAQARQGANLLADRAQQKTQAMATFAALVEQARQFLADSAKQTGAERLRSLQKAGQTLDGVKNPAVFDHLGAAERNTLTQLGTDVEQAIARAEAQESERQQTARRQYHASIENGSKLLAKAKAMDAGQGVGRQQALQQALAELDKAEVKELAPFLEAADKQQLEALRGELVGLLRGTIFGDIEARQHQAEVEKTALTAEAFGEGVKSVQHAFQAFEGGDFAAAAIGVQAARDRFAEVRQREETRKQVLVRCDQHLAEARKLAGEVAAGSHGQQIETCRRALELLDFLADNEIKAALDAERKQAAADLRHDFRNRLDQLTRYQEDLDQIVTLSKQAEAEIRKGASPKGNLLVALDSLGAARAKQMPQAEADAKQLELYRMYLSYLVSDKADPATARPELRAWVARILQDLKITLPQLEESTKLTIVNHLLPPGLERVEAAAPVHLADGIWFRVFPPVVRNQLNVEYVLVPPGTFTLGSDSEQPDFKWNKPQHTVEITVPFYMSRFETTVGEYRRYAEAVRPGMLVEGHKERPLVNVNYQEVVGFCNWLSKSGGISAAGVQRQGVPADKAEAWVFDQSQPGYRLPTEAEWEYSAGAAGEAFDVSATVWFGHDQPLLVSEASEKVRPNPLGLYLMQGNVAEMTADWLWQYTAGGDQPQPDHIHGFDAAFNLAGLGHPLVVRGGAVRHQLDDADAALTFRRYRYPDQLKTDWIGFRTVIPLHLSTNK